MATISNVCGSGQRWLSGVGPPRVWGLLDVRRQFCICFTATGTLQLTATKAAAADYQQRDLGEFTVTINKANHTINVGCA